MLALVARFRQYIATAEANQIKWEEAGGLLEFLPFAIVFGLADRWAKTFEEVAAAAAAAGVSVASPTWYDWAPAASPAIASSMDSFSTVAAGTFVSTRVRPGRAGSAGGGFSGGGGGGSSGGSW